MRHILSFDIAKGKSVYCFIDELRNVIIDASLIEHKKDEFDLLFNKVKNYSNLIVIMESTSIYHLPVETYFRSKGIETIIINPKLVKQFKDTLNKSKTDKLDCFKIARCYLGTIDNFYQKQDEYFKVTIESLMVNDNEVDSADSGEIGVKFNKKLKKNSELFIEKI